MKCSESCQLGVSVDRANPIRSYDLVAAGTRHCGQYCKVSLIKQPRPRPMRDLSDFGQSRPNWNVCAMSACASTPEASVCRSNRRNGPTTETSGGRRLPDFGANIDSRHIVGIAGKLHLISGQYGKASQSSQADFCD